MKKHLQREYDSLEKIMSYLKSKTDLEISIKPDEWITDGSLMLTPGKKCIVVKKSATAGAKINIIDSSTIEIHPIPPSSFVNRATQRGILAIIMHAILLGSQEKIAKDVKNLLLDIQAN
ncbi:hypothetical protein [Aquimarina algicola]|uniref:Uncharacterized protein n=1 Tax=Aquimarina algicola TaxID=2589995 RepID=A0A504IZN4_9FLAO|nr:hypothetical protein [Aquimarina algicola]TPN81218.1 hypothetical protein FHK87_24860 [Aquimarina algicola]